MVLEYHGTTRVLEYSSTGRKLCGSARWYFFRDASISTAPCHSPTLPPPRTPATYARFTPPEGAARRAVRLLCGLVRVLPRSPALPPAAPPVCWRRGHCSRELAAHAAMRHEKAGSPPGSVPFQRASGLYFRACSPLRSAVAARRAALSGLGCDRQTLERSRLRPTATATM